MPDPGFQVTIVSPSEPFSPAPNEALPDPEDRFTVTPHSRKGEKVIARIEALEGIWDKVVAKLTGLAEKSETTAALSKFELDSIEFNIGIEAGLSVGLVTKGEASVSLTFKRKP